MSHFKERLWRELVREHGAHLEQTRRPPPRRSRRPQLLVGSTVGLVAAGTAAALVLSAASSSPAFAVARNHDGTVTVKIWRAAGIAGANNKLRALGVRAQVVQVSVKCAASSVTAQRFHPTAGRGLAQARIDPRAIPAGRTLVITSWQEKKGRQVALAQNFVARAQSVRAPRNWSAAGCGPPPCGPPPSGNSDSAQKALKVVPQTTANSRKSRQTSQRLGGAGLRPAQSRIVTVPITCGGAGAPKGTPAPSGKQRQLR
jgi:hypothetical protein